MTSRGNAQAPIFLDDVDRERFLSILASVVSRYHWVCHAYCLLDNHYHLVLETPTPTLRIGMRQLNGLYAQRFNRRHGRVGHVFQGRYAAILVEREAHLLELCRYVVLNPVRAGACGSAEAWPWSSHNATAGLAPVPRFLALNWILSQFGADGPRARRRYRQFIAEGVAARRPWSALRGGIYLGSEAFAEAHAHDTGPLPDVPRAHWQPVRPPLAHILTEKDDAAISRAVRDYGYRLREVAAYLEVHVSTASRRLRQVEARLAVAVAMAERPTA